MTFGIIVGIVLTISGISHLIQWAEIRRLSKAVTRQHRLYYAHRHDITTRGVPIIRHDWKHASRVTPNQRSYR